MRVRHVACGVRRCMWVWRLREDHVELSRCACPCVREGRGRMCGSPRTYRARQAAVPRRDGHGVRTRPGPGAAAGRVPTGRVFERRAGPVILVFFSRGRAGEFVRALREIAILSRIMILYEDDLAWAPRALRRDAPLSACTSRGVARGKVSRRAVVRSTQTVGRRDRQTFIRLGPAPHKFVSMCHFDCLPRIQVEEEIGAWCHGAA